MTRLDLRPALPGDLAAITPLYAHEVQHGVATYEYNAPDIAEMTRRWQAIVGHRYPYLVAELDGRLAGYAYASSWRSREGYRWTVEDTVYVAPDMQGRGVGRGTAGTPGRGLHPRRVPADDWRDRRPVQHRVDPGRPRPDPRVAASEHLKQFSHAALVVRARGMLRALSDLE